MWDCSSSETTIDFCWFLDLPLNVAACSPSAHSTFRCRPHLLLASWRHSAPATTARCDVVIRQKDVILSFYYTDTCTVVYKSFQSLVCPRIRMFALTPWYMRVHVSCLCVYVGLCTCTIVCNVHCVRCLSCKIWQRYFLACLIIWWLQMINCLGLIIVS